MKEDKKIKLKILLISFFVTFLKLIDTPCSIYQHIFTGIKRMGSIGDFQFYYRVFFTVFPLHSFLGRSSGTAQKHSAVTHIPEYHEPVI